MRPFIVPAAALVFAAVAANAQQVSTVSLTGFDGMGGLTVGPDGHVYCANFGQTGSIPNGTNAYRLLSDGTPVEFATGFEGASGNEFDSMGNYFQASFGGNRINKVDTLGVNTVFADSTDGVNSPVGIVFDATGNMYVCMFYANQVMKFDPAGSGTVFVNGSGLSWPSGIAIDDDGILYAVHFQGGAITKILPDGTASFFANLPGFNATHITYVGGYLYAVCRDTNRVYRITLDGVVSVLAGSGQCGRASGPALEARFSYPNGIEGNAAGDTLFVNQSKMPCPLNINPAIVRIITDFNPATSIGGDLPSASSARWSLRNEPNPFQGSTRIQYQLPAGTRASNLAVFDSAGRRIREWDLRERDSAGSLDWDGNDADGKRVSAGAYFCMLRTEDGETKSGRMVLVR